jgi:trehalose-6-phosphate synthase
LEELKVEPVNEKIRRIQIKLAVTCNKNEQQQDGKNIIKQVDEDDLEDLGRDCMMRLKQVYQGLTHEGL